LETLLDGGRTKPVLVSGAFSVYRLRPQISIYGEQAMTKETKFKAGRSGSPETRFKPGNKNRWVPGVSGNPAGKSRQRVCFEEAFNEALLTEGSPEEAAKLLWEAARAREPWAIQSLCQRFAPQAQSLRLIHEVDNDGIDYSKLSDKQVEQLDAIFEQAGIEPLALEGGEGPAQAA
jgi:hypothetical protein